MAQTKPRFKVTQYALGDIHIERLPDPDQHPANIFAAGRGCHVAIDNPNLAPAPAEVASPDTTAVALEPEPVDEAASDFNQSAPEAEAPADSVEAQLASLHERIATLEETVRQLVDALLERGVNQMPIVNQAVAEAEPEQSDEQPAEESEQSDEQPEADPEHPDEEESPTVVVPVVIPAEVVPAEAVAASELVSDQPEPEPEQPDEQPEVDNTPEAQEAQAEQAIAAEAAGVIAVDETVRGGRRKKRFAAIREKLSNLRQKKLVRRAIATVALLGVLGAGIYCGLRDDDSAPDSQPAVTRVEPAPTTITPATTIVVDPSEFAPDTSYHDSSSNQLEQSANPTNSPCSFSQQQHLNDSISHQASNIAFICDVHDTEIKLELGASVEKVNSILQSPQATITTTPDPEQSVAEGRWKSYQDERGDMHYSDPEPEPEKVVCTDTATGEEVDCPF